MGDVYMGPFGPFLVYGWAQVDRTAIFVDAGYLFAQGSLLIAGKKLSRSETALDEVKALAFLEAIAAAATGLPLLRTYWYDGTDSRPSRVHVSLAKRANVKMRLGIVNAFGEQKGVDSLIVTDLINLSRNRAMSDAVLLTGDEDIRVGVQHAQELGVRVHLVGLEDAANNQSKLLRQEADTLREISKSEVHGFLSQLPLATPAPAAPIASAAANTPTSLQDAVVHFAAALSQDDVDRVVNDPTGHVPSDLDSQLLRAGAAAIQARSLAEQEKRELRRAFIAACKSRP